MLDPVLHFRALPALYCQLHRDPSNSLSQFLTRAACQSMRLSQFPLQEGLVMQAQSLLQVFLYLPQIFGVPLPWVQEKSKQRKHVSPFITWGPRWLTQNPLISKFHMALLSGLRKFVFLLIPCALFLCFLSWLPLSNLPQRQPLAKPFCHTVWISG